MTHIRYCLAVILAAALCFSAAVSCGEEAPRVIVPETNTEYRTDLYPYVVHGQSASLYIAAADIELFGLEDLCASLSRTMEDLEADFADARNALSEYLTEDIPAVRICTDFCDHAERAGESAAYYNGVGNFIKVFHSWSAAKASLLHEYVHYLTFTCARTPVRFGFWSEGIADYVSAFVCRNRLFRSVSAEMSEEVRGEARDRGVLDPDGTVDEKRAYYVTAEMFRRGDAVETSYYAVSNQMIQRTEKIQQDPKPDQLSYYEAACMVDYLTETYGQDEVFSHWDCDPEHMQDVFGRSFPELYRAWADWNTRQCGDLGLVTD